MIPRPHSLACLWQSSAAAPTDAGQENVDPHALRQHAHASHPGTPEGAGKDQGCSSPSPAALGPRTPANMD